MVEASYSVQLEPWRDFYTLTGTAAATLMGLLFVALSLNPRIMTDTGSEHLRAWAGQTMSNLVALVILSLICMMPDLDSPAFALALLLTGGQGLVRATIRLRHVLVNDRGAWRARDLILRLVLPIGAYVIMLWVASAEFTGTSRAGDWLVWAVFLLVSSAAEASWTLLAELGRDKSG